MKITFPMQDLVLLLPKKGEILSWIAYYIYLLLVSDCIISTSGRWLMLGPLSIRMALGLMAIGFAIPKIINKFSALIRNPMVISLSLFIVNLFISAIYGFYRGNRFDVLVSDLKGFAWLSIIPVGMVLFDSKEKILMLMKVFVGSAVIHSLLVITLDLSLVFFDSDIVSITKFFEKTQFGFVDFIAEDLYRFSHGSTLFVVAGCVFMMYFQMYQKKLNLLYVFSTALCYFTILISYTRSVYAATFIALTLSIFVFFFYFPKKKKSLLLFLVITLVTIIILVQVFQTTLYNNYMIFGLKRTFPNTSFDTIQYLINTTLINRLGLSYLTDQNIPASVLNSAMDEYFGGLSYLTDQNIPASVLNSAMDEYFGILQTSDSIRNTTKSELLEMIRVNPLWGNGLGASIESRSKGLVEYIYFDLINKVGIIGLLLYLFPVMYMLYSQVRTQNPHMRLIKYLWFCGLSAFLFATYFNPYMNCSLGICFYGLCIATHYVSDEKNETLIPDLGINDTFSVIGGSNERNYPSRWSRYTSLPLNHGN